MAKDSNNIDLLKQAEITFCTGSKYIGEWSHLGMSGKGIYTFPNGVKYHGGMLDGQFHETGKLRYPTGHILKGSWYRGTLQTVFNHIFSDGLKFDTICWKYCTSSDRRFQECRLNGIPGVHATLMAVPCKDGQQFAEKNYQKNTGTISEAFSFINLSVDED